MTLHVPDHGKGVSVRTEYGIDDCGICAAGGGDHPAVCVHPRLGVAGAAGRFADGSRYAAFKAESRVEVRKWRCGWYA